MKFFPSSRTRNYKVDYNFNVQMSTLPLKYLNCFRNIEALDIITTIKKFKNKANGQE